MINCVIRQEEFKGGGCVYREQFVQSFEMMSFKNLKLFFFK
jgi:hypothetical protein